jgi:O-methyltransferase domain/Dimerisation domain
MRDSIEVLRSRKSQPTEEASRIQLRRMILGYQISQCVHVAAKLGIADLLENGRKSIGELATATRTHPPSLERLLRALSSHGVFAVGQQGRFSLTPVGNLLRSRAKDSLSAAAIYWGERWIWEPWGNLLHSVRTGAPAFDHVHGVSFFNFLARTPEAAQVFDLFISEGLHTRPHAVVAAHDFSLSKVIADVGGGQGAMLVEILKANPAARGILFDRPHVIEGARSLLRYGSERGRYLLAVSDYP